MLSAHGRGHANRVKARSRGYACSGAVFGCLLEELVYFCDSCASFSPTETVNLFKKIASVSAARAMSLSGEDALALQRGFASDTVARSQRLRAKSPKANLHPRVCRRGVVVGLSVAIEFATHAFVRVDRMCAVMVVMVEPWISEVFDKLTDIDKSALPAYQATALDAERRAVERALAAARVARLHVVGHLRHSDTHNMLRLYRAVLQRAMWPEGRAVGEQTQQQLLDWIESAEFLQSALADTPPVARPAPLDVTLSVPLSAMAPDLLEDDASSTSDLSSRTSSSARSSADSGGGEDAGSEACAPALELSRQLSSL